MAAYTFKNTILVFRVHDGADDAKGLESGSIPRPTITQLCSAPVDMHVITCRVTCLACTLAISVEQARLHFYSNAISRTDRQDISRTTRQRTKQSGNGVGMASYMIC